MKQNFKLTKDQQTLVEKNLSIVHWVIVNNIHVNSGICGLEYGDLFQEGCLWLCKAAFTYNAGQAQFSTYAKKVVKNGLLSYCRKICSQGRHVSRLIIGEQGELAADGEQVDQPDDHFDSHLSRLETLDLLEASKQNYQGVARLGIEALTLLAHVPVSAARKLFQKPNEERKETDRFEWFSAASTVCWAGCASARRRKHLPHFACGGDSGGVGGLRPF